MSFKALVLSGDGVNCEIETSNALAEVGFQSEVIHINELIQNPKTLENFQLLAFPGGFSFGDEIQSGKILALKIQKYLINEIRDFIESGKLVIGICNGFQVLTSLNAFTDFNSEESHFALVPNDQAQFINRWVEMKPNFQNHSPWLKNLPESFHLPIRHGEGNLKVSSKFQEQFSNYQAVSYTKDVNGSYKQTAAITNEKGNVFGIMPHPEAAMTQNLDPTFNTTSKESHWGSIFFKNAYNYLEDMQ